jgi:hypothetical protein
MPLLDHFHPPLVPHHHWESFHSNWATRLADGLAELVPADFIVEEHMHAGPGFEIDVATFADGSPPANGPASAASLATRTVAACSPPLPDRVLPAVFPDSFEIRVFSTLSGLTLVAVIELVSPSNKDRPAERRAFVAKCASYLAQGVSLIVVDVVTSRCANLHNELMQFMQADNALHLADEVNLSAVAYRPVIRGDRQEIDLWLRPLAIGANLPTLPLRLTSDLCVPVDFEVAYQEACRRRRLG